MGGDDIIYLSNSYLLSTYLPTTYPSQRSYIQIYKEFLQISREKTDNLIKKWAVDLNKYVVKADIQMANKYHKSTLKYVQLY